MFFSLSKDEVKKKRNQKSNKRDIFSCRRGEDKKKIHFEKSALFLQKLFPHFSACFKCSNTTFGVLFFPSSTSSDLVFRVQVCAHRSRSFIRRPIILSNKFLTKVQTSPNNVQVNYFDSLNTYSNNLL